jgi:hypothetical protein
VDLHDDSIHYLAYPDVEPPRRAHSPVLPSDEEISFLFQPPFLPGTPRTPDRLIREAYVVHYALRRSVLYRMGNAESLTGVQQWLLMYVMAKRPFDLVDIVGVLDRQTYQGGTRGSRLCGEDHDRETENSKVCTRTPDTRFIQVRATKVANPTSCLGDQVWRPALGVGLRSG